MLIYGKYLVDSKIFTNFAQEINKKYIIMKDLIRDLLLVHNNNRSQIIIVPTIVYVCINVYTWIFCTQFIALCTLFGLIFPYMMWVAYRDDEVLQIEFEEEKKINI